jgi:hypothetical protein
MSVAVVEPAGLTINDPRRRIFATIEASVSNPVKWYDCRSYSRGAVSSRSKAFDVVGTALPMTSLYTSCGAPVKAEPFPTQVRALGVGSLTRSRTQYSAGRQSMQLFSSSHGVSRRIPSVCHCSLRRGFSRCDLDARYESKRIHLEGKETV